MLRRIAIGAVMVLAVCAASALRIAAHDRFATAVTWDREIQPIVQARCLSCHRDAHATLSLASYETARPWARAIRNQVLTRRMPVWRAARGYGEFANDPSLSPFEINLIVSWVDGGAPKTIASRGVAPAVVGPIIVPPASAPRERGHDVTLPCNQPAPVTGWLLGLRPQLDRAGSVRVVAAQPDGGREVLGWFRDVDPADTAMYWLREPLKLQPGARFVTEVTDSASCSIIATVR